MKDGIYLLDKPTGYTCQQVLNRLKKMFPKKKLGHLGTLDPFASGVLPVFVGEMTKLIPYADDEPKVYEAEMDLGYQTDTLDITGEVTARKEVPVFDEEKIKEVFLNFLGLQKQKPPQYSAVKIKGKPLYQYARAGIEMEVKEREVTVHHLELLRFDPKTLCFRASVSKGTYIRSLACDLAQALGSLGTLRELRRLRSGVFFISESHPLDEFLEAPTDLVSQWNINPIKMIKGLSCYCLEDEGLWKEFLLGRWMKDTELSIKAEDKKVFIQFQNSNAVIAEWVKREQGGVYYLKPIRVVFGDSTSS